MKARIIALAITTVMAAPAVGQDMPGMKMPPAHHQPATPTPAPASTSSPARNEQGQMPPDHEMPTAQSDPVADATPSLAPAGGMTMQDGAIGHSAGMSDSMPGMAMAPIGYAEGSGTSRLPAGQGAMQGVHLAAGEWMVMLHGYVWGVYTDQGGPRGGREGFVQSMAMAQATRDLGGARVQLRSMLSLDPLIGARGYPNLFATGETADGVAPLIDRQHPHDLFMELAARVDVDIAKGTNLFAYAGPVAEPALGPAAFMHRASARYIPDSPITHHWFDSTHISYGVVTGGIAAQRWQLEASAFRGREPDQYRWDIETPRLDSWSVRATWTPSPAWALQVSHGHIRSPEALEPGVDERRTTASVHYAAGGVNAMLGYALKDKSPGRALPGWLAELNWDVTRHHSLFARAERVSNDELFPDPADPRHDRRFTVGKLEGGYAYGLPITGPLEVAFGGSLAAYAKPAMLNSAYGRFPLSYTLFAKFSVGH